MSNKFESDECPSFTDIMNFHHLRCMHVVYYGCQSNMMDVHHIWGITVINVVCPSYIWAYFMMEPKESLVGGINVKDMMDYVVMVELMKSEVREYMESMELIKLMELVKRETIDLGIDIWWNWWNLWK